MLEPEFVLGKEPGRDVEAAGRGRGVDEIREVFVAHFQIHGASAQNVALGEELPRPEADRPERQRALGEVALQLRVEQREEVVAAAGEAGHCLIEDYQDQMVILADKGFKAKAENPTNLKICERGKWNQRMLIETVFSLFTGILKLKKLS